MKFKNYINESTWPTKIDHNKKTYMEYKGLDKNTLNWLKSTGVGKFKPYAVYSDKGRMEVMTNLSTSDWDDTHKKTLTKLQKGSSKAKHMRFIQAEDQQGSVVLVFQNSAYSDKDDNLDWMDD